MELERLHDEVAILKTAIEEAIRERQKSVDGLSDVHWSSPISNKKSVTTRVNSGLRVAGWGDDF